MNEFTNLPAIIVPARLASTRLPRKLLMDIGGKPLILWTAERLREVASEFELFFAVDGEDLGAVLESNGFSVIQTDPDLASGTDRIAAANELIKAKTVINVQADEPLIHREHILSLVESVNSSSISMSTIAVPFENEEDFVNLMLFKNTGISIPKNTMINSKFNKNVLLIEIQYKDEEQTLKN